MTLIARKEEVNMSSRYHAYKIIHLKY